MGSGDRDDDVLLASKKCSLVKDGTFVFQGYHNTRDWESLTAEMYFLTALEDTSPRLGCP